MAFTNYTELQAEVADFLDRDDLTDKIPSFIALGEVEIMRRLQITTERVNFEVDEAAEAIPSGVLIVRAVRPVTSQPHLDLPLTLVTPEEIGERVAGYDGVAGRPRFWAVVGDNIVFAPAPDDTYTLELTYYPAVGGLASIGSNALLLAAPDAYLYGAMLAAEKYNEHDERVPLWRTEFDRAIDQLEALRDRKDFSGSPKRARLPVVFG